MLKNLDPHRGIARRDPGGVAQAVARQMPRNSSIRAKSRSMRGENSGGLDGSMAILTSKYSHKSHFGCNQYLKIAITSSARRYAPAQSHRTTDRAGQSAEPAPTQMPTTPPMFTRERQVAVLVAGG